MKENGSGGWIEAGLLCLLSAETGGQAWKEYEVGDDYFAIFAES